MKTRNISILLVIVIFSAGFASAQGRWTINREKGEGDLISVYFTSSKDGWVAGDKGFLAYTNDGGKSWNKTVLSTVANINEIYFRNDNNGYLVAGRKMFQTSDGGKNWREDLIVNPAEFKDGIPEFLSIRFNSKDQGFIVGTIIDKNDEERIIGSLLLRTMDGGKTWSRIAIPAKVELFNLDFDGKSNGWIVGDEGTIFATRDKGNSWVKQNSGTDAALYSVHFRDNDNGFAVGMDGTVVATTDGGNTWHGRKLDFKGTLFRVFFVNKNEGWIVGSKGNVFRTVDRGETWFPDLKLTNNSLYGLFMNKKYGWAVGSEGVIIKYEK
ncbi:MAG: YCF48-related protein [Pyrinomonadaceae bacterium]